MSIIEFFKKVTDKRGFQGRRYKSWSILSLILLSRLSGYQGIKATWRLGKNLKSSQLKALGLKDTRPTYQCILYIVGKIDSDKFEAVLSDIIQALSVNQGSRLVSIDGKRLRNSSLDVDKAIHI